LKRSLPKRAANKSSEPVHNVIANDTYESITDYNSASPHVKTLQRFQELNVGMTRQDQKFIRDSTMSAMESSFDFTDKDTTPKTASTGAMATPDRRWKYKAARVRTMTPADFNDYLRTKVHGRRAQFMNQLRARAHRQNLRDVRDAAKTQMEMEDQHVGNVQNANIAFTATNAYTNWIDLMDIRVLEDYLMRLPRLFEPHDWYPDKMEDMHSTGTRGYEDMHDILNSAVTLNPVVSRPYIKKKWSETKLNKLSTSTLSVALTYHLKNEWWTAELEEDMSRHGRLLRQKLAHTIEPDTEAPPPRYPPLSAANARDWLKFLKGVEQAEIKFLRTWYTREEDGDGAYFANYLHNLRKDTTLASPLNNIVREFLDMPPVKASGNKRRDAQTSSVFSAQESAFDLTTHPTAGLSYLRSNNILHNHPILGPQRSAPSVRARVISPMPDSKTLFGIAGFVGDHVLTKRPMGFDEPGGAKENHVITNTYVDGAGRIHITHRSDPNPEAVRIRDGVLERSDEEYMRQQRSSALSDVIRGGARTGHAAGLAPKAKPLENKVVDQLKILQSQIDRQSGFKPTYE
jgi:hypothetical protein